MINKDIINRTVRSFVDGELSLGLTPLKYHVPASPEAEGDRTETRKPTFWAAQSIHPLALVSMLIKTRPSTESGLASWWERGGAVRGRWTAAGCHILTISYGRSSDKRRHSLRTWRGCTLRLPHPLRLQYGSWQRNRTRVCWMCTLVTSLKRAAEMRLKHHLLTSNNYCSLTWKTAGRQESSLLRCPWRDTGNCSRKHKGSVSSRG